MRPSDQVLGSVPGHVKEVVMLKLTAFRVLTASREACRRSVRLLLVLPVLLASLVVTSQPASAASSDIPWTATNVKCLSWPVRQIMAEPRLRTQAGWEWGQWVSYRFHIQNMTSGAWVVNERSYRPSVFIATSYWGTDGIGHDVANATTHVGLPEMAWDITGPASRYVVWTDYIWWNGQNWTFKQTKSGVYTNGFAVGDQWVNKTESTCLIR